MNPLRDNRVRKGWSVRALSEKSGVHFTTINQLETGKRKAEHYTLGKLAIALGIDWKELASLAKTPIDTDKDPNSKAAA
jgi:transcriptional regulator with XRE-family HTH domain